MYMLPKASLFLSTNSETDALCVFPSTPTRIPHPHPHPHPHTLKMIKLIELMKLITLIFFPDFLDKKLLKSHKIQPFPSCIWYLILHDDNARRFGSGYWQLDWKWFQELVRWLVQPNEKGHQCSGSILRKNKLKAGLQHYCERRTKKLF